MTPSPTGPASGSLDSSRWQVWWSYNRDQYLQLGRFLTGLGSSSARGARPTQDEVRGVIAPALESVLRAGGKDELLRGTLVSYARLEAEHGKLGLGLDHYVGHLLAVGGPSVQEAAILALGVRGDSKSVAGLSDLLLDTEAGQASIGGLPVGVRLRAFAAYSLGLLGSQLGEDDAKLEAVDALLTALGASHSTTRETQVATAVSVGLVPLTFCGGDPERLARHAAEADSHLCGGIQLNYLLATFADPALDPWLRAHTAAAMGRLAREAPPEFREAVAQSLLSALDSSKEAVEVRQGAAIGLGLFADGDEERVDEVARQRLKRHSKKGDPLVRRFSLVGLAQASARRGSGVNDGAALEETQKYLLQLLSHGKHGIEPWAAMALAVQGHTEGQSRGTVSEDLARALRHKLATTKSLDLASACVLALGVLRDYESADEVAARFEKNEDPLFRAYAALTLGLVSAREASDLLRVSLEEAESPQLGLELAVGLRLLGDTKIQDGLVQRLGQAETASERAATARVLGLVGDRRAVAALVAVLEDAEEPADVRNAAALALGQITDGDRVAWNTPFSSDVNYRALTWTLSSPFGDRTGLLDIR